jgi:hypothetical protein
MTILPNPGQFDRDGYAIVPGVLGPDEVNDLIAAVAAVRPGGAALDRGGAVYASRNLLADAPAVRSLAGSPAVRALVEPVLGPESFVVRGLLFDKTADANWMVPWHQDLTISVRERREAEGFGPWTVKAGVPHVQPPVDVLERMVTVRLHLDDPDGAHGPLRVIPGSHRAGRLNAAETRRWLDRAPSAVCLVPRGGALVMRPLLLHASSAADPPGSGPRPRHRRVIHLEFAAHPLPHGLAWAQGA